MSFARYNIPDDIYSQVFPENNKYKVQNQQGYGFTPFRGKKNQRGYGIGNILGSLFRTISPFIKPALKGVARGIFQEGLKIGENVLKKQNPPQTLSSLNDREIKKLAEKLQKGKKRKEKSLTYITPKRVKKDIFDP